MTCLWHVGRYGHDDVTVTAIFAWLLEGKHVSLKSYLGQLVTMTDYSKRKSGWENGHRCDIARIWFSTTHTCYIISNHACLQRTHM